jgi:hypothetical protein
MKATMFVMHSSHYKSAARLRAVTILVLLFQTLGTSQRALAEQDSAVDCSVARPSTPPPSISPPRQIGPDGKERKANEEDQLAAVQPKRACAEGQVPTPRAYKPDKPGPMKGNPLLRPGSERNPTDRTGRNAFLSFDQVYKKKNMLRAARPCDGTVYEPGGYCYYYGSAALQQNVYGAGMTLSIHRPKVEGSDHTLAELSVQGGPNNGNIVEIGWNIRPCNTETPIPTFSSSTGGTMRLVATTDAVGNR